MTSAPSSNGASVRAGGDRRKAGSGGRITRIFAALLLAAGGSALAETPLRVTVALAPYASIVGAIGGDLVSVTTLLPPGASPHAFDPSPSQAAGLATSDLIVMNGGIDAWLDRLVAAAAPTASVLVITQSISFTPMMEGHDHDVDHAGDLGDGHDDSEPGPDPDTTNPHVWLDPVLMSEAAAAIAAELERLDPDNATAYSARLTHVRSELAALNAEIAALLEPVRGAPFVPFHDAWPYFAERYGLNLVLSLEPFPGREPSPKYVAEAVAAVKAAGAKAVFAERQLNPRSAEVVAESAGVAVAVLDPIGGAPGPTDYAELVRYNARIILANLR